MVYFRQVERDGPKPKEPKLTRKEKKEAKKDDPRTKAEKKADKKKEKEEKKEKDGEGKDQKLKLKQEVLEIEKVRFLLIFHSLFHHFS